MKGRRGKKQPERQEKGIKVTEDSDDDADVGDIFTDEIDDFTESRNKVSLGGSDSESDEQEEIFGLADDDDEESDEEIGEWSKRLKQIKFQAKLDKKKALPDETEKSWGTKRSAFYGSGVKRKPKEAESDKEDEWLMEEKEIEKLQKKLDEDLDEDDFLIPSLQKSSTAKTKVEVPELKVKRNLSDKEKEELRRKVHPEVEPLKKELDNCLLELENLKAVKGWKAESRDTCFRLLAANIAFYLHLVDTDEDCRGHPVLKRILQWKKLAKMYEAVPMDQMEASDDEELEKEDDKEDAPSFKKARMTLEDSENEQSNDEEGDDIEGRELDNSEEQDETGNRPITYEIEKNKQKKKSAPNNPRVKHREKFRKAKIRRKGKIREYRPEINKYQGEASGIRAGIVRSVRLK